MAGGSLLENTPDTDSQSLDPADSHGLDADVSSGITISYNDKTYPKSQG